MERGDHAPQAGKSEEEKHEKQSGAGHESEKRSHHAPQAGKNCEKRRKTRTDRQEKKEK